MASIPSNPTPQTVAALLPKLQDADPDYRFMSLNDLFQVLTVGRPDFLHNDYNTAARAVDGVIKALDDQNGEVQNLAIKCLPSLVQKIPHTMIGPTIEKLSSLTIENSVDNSVPAMALRSVVVTLPRPVQGVTPSKEVSESYSAISRVLIPRLVGHIVDPPPTHMKLPSAPSGGLLHAEHKEVDAEGVDVLIEVVRCFGPMLLEAEIVALQAVVVRIIDNDRAGSVVKKRAVVAVAILAGYLSDQGLSAFVSKLIQSFTNPHVTHTQRRLYITILGSMARSIPSRFGPYLKTLAPFVLSALSEQEYDEQMESRADDGEQDIELNDVRESALVALEGFLSSCGSEMRPFTEESVAAALRYLKYDPNYNEVDDDEEMGGTQSDEDEDDMDFDEDDEFADDGGFDDDDDDASWKVRRCAAKVLYTLISTRGSGDLLDDGTLYSQVAPILIKRFNEREQNVRLEVIATMASMIRKTGEGSAVEFATEDNADYLNNAPSRKRRRESSSITFDTKPSIARSAGLTSPTIEPLPSSGPRADLGRLTPAIIKAVSKQLKGPSIPTKQAVINLLQSMVAVQHGGLSEYVGSFIDLIIDAVKGTGLPASSTALTSGGAASATPSTLRIAALRLISDLAESHSSSVLQPYLVKIVPAVVGAIDEKFYKVSCEAVGTAEQLVKALTPPRSRSGGEKHQADLKKLFDAFIGRIEANDADLEVRQRALQALSILVARTSGEEGSTLLSAADRNTALEVLKDRLKNETTRLVAIRSINNIAAFTTTKEQLDTNWIREVCLELSGQLRKADRGLRSASLDTLKNLIITPAARNNLDANTISSLVGALHPLLTIDDLHLLGPALLVSAALVEDDAKLVVTDQMIGSICGLLSTSLGGAVLDALLLLVRKIGEHGAGARLMTKVLKDVSINGDPAVVGKVIGSLLVYGGPSVGVTIDSFLQELNSVEDEARQSLALAVLGEAGFRLGQKSTLKPDVFTAHFASKFSKLPLAAAVAMGRAGAGNVPLYLPVILSEMKGNDNTQYLLLHSIKEILQQGGGTLDVSSYSQDVWDRLMAASNIEDNKAVAAECIGRLAILNPQTFIPTLQTQLKAPSASTRAMAIQALRYTLPDSDQNFDVVLSSGLVDMLTTMLTDQELENRRLALTTLTSAVHNKAELVLPHLSQLLPSVIDESVPKPELIRDVKMGPFTIKVDDGMDLRKSAYETLYSLMENSFSRLNILTFFDRIIAGLSDEHDIRGLCNLMLTKLVVLDPEETARRLDAIAEAFRTTLSVKLKDNAVKQEIEKQDEAVKSVLRVTLLLNERIPAAANTLGISSGLHQTWRTYWEWVEKDFEPQLRTIRDESKISAAV